MSIEQLPNLNEGDRLELYFNPSSQARASLTALLALAGTGGYDIIEPDYDEVKEIIELGWRENKNRKIVIRIERGFAADHFLTLTGRVLDRVEAK